MARSERSHIGALVAGILITGTGSWAFLAPQSFYDNVATFPPYNEHLLHDAGSFLTGLGVAFFLTMWWRSALTIVFGANAVAAILHAISHIIDRDLGGKASDPWLLSAVAIVLTAVTVRRLASER
jgi:hypothetical protein